ncbi:uncharacterized protein MELLADRAFT_92264 [Melampsora larici-populina 98AG31]|uniref:Uncharacterized protein n=1 Tax=Melampsora larici-populina (strain 98AG31 / pathotype 3-4-7) TaxID=747676 RepID=F4R904_MELLP|nr:uncharacterized protein MELLADRAFT_92264 [Melampsora larici-populina 98AG31]EGG10901.1 hypothetical protein MELLADRAFT_92264 [Melampsora larici-populina 98AG31]
MLTFDQTLNKIIRLCDNCPALREGTRQDKTYMRFSNPPTADEDEGMWYPVNTTLDAVFGVDCIKLEISKGPFGLPLVVEWVQQARKHHTWDGDSDKLIKIKLDNIISALQDAGAEDHEVDEPHKTNSVVGNKRRISRIESNPTTSNSSNSSKSMDDPKRPTKQFRTAAPAKISDGVINSSEVILVLSSDEEERRGFSKKNSAKRELRNVKVVNLCPLSTPNKNCNRCKVETRLGGKHFSCHCGAKLIWLSGGRVRPAETHWATEICKDKTEQLRSNTQLTSYFTNSTTSNSKMIEVPCPGLHDGTWERPKARHTIAYFLSKTFSVYRGNFRHKICQDLFGAHAQESKLTKEQKSKLMTTLDAQSKWQVKRHGDRNAIYSSNCEKTFLCNRTIKNAICTPCEQVKGMRSLIRALNSDYAEEETLKYTPNNLMEDHQTIFSPTLLKLADFRLLQTSIEAASKGDFSDFLTVMAASARNGLFDNRDAARAMIKAVAVKAERVNSGKTTRGMKIDSCLDEFVMTLGAISPRALSLFNDNFAGRSQRSLRMIRARDDMHLLDGLHITNFNRISQVLKELGYSGPIATASDQTVCVKRLRHHNGFLVGAQGGDISFDDPSELPDLVRSVVKKKELCSKIRAYTLQVPLPNVPTFVVALIASCDKETSNDILENHHTFMKLSQDAGINILSIGADGAPTELCAQIALAESATQFITYENSDYDVHVKVPLMGNPPRPVVMVQDPKHARKTGANQLGSGARLIVMGNYHVSIQQVATILQSGRSPLLHKDVFDCDKQDDGRAFRTLNSGTLADWTSREDSISMDRRVLLKTLEEVASQPTSRTSQANELFSKLSHREYYPNYPLLPWKHGSEPVEHIFGWMRVISPRFTVLDARMMMPKIHAIVKNVMSGRINLPSSEHMHAGYQYAFSDEPKDENLDFLAQFPTDSEISEDLAVAYEQADQLTQVSGMGSLKSLDQEVPARDLDDLHVESPENFSDISVCTTQQYDILYEYKGNVLREKQALEAAAHLTKEENSVDLLLDALPEDAHTKSLQNAAMSIANLLNPAPVAEHHNQKSNELASDIAIGPLVIETRL